MYPIQMNRNFFLSIVSVLLLIGCKEKNAPSNQTLGINQTLDSLHLDLEKASKEILIPGFSVALAHKDSVLFSEGYGISDIANEIPFTENTKHTIASISKTFIGVAIMKLVAQGKLHLDAPINTILPFEINSPHYPDIPITVNHLVTHTSTISDDFDDGDKSPSWFIEPYPFNVKDLPEDYQEDLYYFDGSEMSLETLIKNACTPEGKWYATTNFLEFRPGERYEYSDMGASIAGRIVEIVSGMSFADYTQKHIFDPLGMDNTSWYYDDLANASKLYIEKTKDSAQVLYEFPRYHEAGYPNGQLKTTATDMSLYLIEMIKGYNSQGTILDNNSYTLMLNPQLSRQHHDPTEEPSTYPFDDEYNVGVFWSISPTGFRIHNGGMNGGFSTLYFNPENDMGVFLMANMADGSFGNLLDILLEYEGEIGRRRK